MKGIRTLFIGKGLQKLLVLQLNLSKVRKNNTIENVLTLLS